MSADEASRPATERGAAPVGGADEGVGDGAGTQRRSGIPRVAVTAAERVPGTVGEHIVGTLRRLRAIRFVGLAGELAFFLTLGLPPLIVAVLALVGVLTPTVGEQASTVLEARLSTQLLLHLDGTTESDALNALAQLLAGRVGLVFGPLLVAIYVSGRGFTGAMRGLAYLHGTDVHRPYWRDLMVTMSFTTGAAVLGVLTLLGAVFGPLSGSPFVDIYSWARWVVIPAGVTVFFTLLYRYSRTGGGPWSRDVPGAVVATAGMVASVLAYAAYVRSSPELGMGPFIGPILGVTVATLTVVFAVAAFVLIGGAFNAHRAGDHVTIGPEAR